MRLTLWVTVGIAFGLLLLSAVLASVVLDARGLVGGFGLWGVAAFLVWPAFMTAMVWRNR